MSDSTTFGIEQEPEPDSGSFTLQSPKPKKLELDPLVIRSVNEYEIEEKIGEGGTSAVYIRA